MNLPWALKLALGAVAVVVLAMVVAIIASGKGGIGALAAVLTLAALVLMVWLGVTFGGRSTPNVEPRRTPAAGMAERSTPTPTPPPESDPE